MKRPSIVRPTADQLGYDTSDFTAVARQMAGDALSGRTQEAVAAELAAIRARFAGRRP